MLASTFSLTCFAWILFRAQSLPDAVYIATHLWSGWKFNAIGTPYFLLRQLLVAIVSILVLESGQLFGSKIGVPSLLGKMPTALRWSAYGAFVMIVIMFGVYRNTQFIYFQF